MTYSNVMRAPSSPSGVSVTSRRGGSHTATRDSILTELGQLVRSPHERL
jgi:hypothetical protein